MPQKVLMKCNLQLNMQSIKKVFIVEIILSAVAHTRYVITAYEILTFSGVRTLLGTCSPAFQHIYFFFAQRDDAKLLQV